MKNKGIFITGTDTGVGKTIVSAVLARLLKMRGCNVGVMKPVTSGCREEDSSLVSDDARILCQAAAIPYSALVAPYCLSAPLAPAESARRENVTINFNKIRESFEQLCSQYDFVIVEGAGGLMVPLAGGLMIADLAIMLQLPLLVVARPSLGTINHTVLTCFSAQQMGIQVAGVIINNYPSTPDQAEKSASHHIGSLCGAPVLGVWPHRDELDELELIENIADWLDGQAETDIVLRELGL